MEKQEEEQEWCWFHMRAICPVCHLCQSAEVDPDVQRAPDNTVHRKGCPKLGTAG